MSVTTARSDSEEPISPADLVAYFAEGAKPRSEWRVGAEFEKLALDRATGAHLAFDRIETILIGLAGRFGWEETREAGHVTTLARAGSTITVEPGGQVELSTPPADRLEDIERELSRHLRELRAVSGPGVAWCAAGLTPVTAVADIPLNPRPRHRLMADYLPTRSPFSLHMMKATASTQATFDYADEADAARKISTALRLGPAVNALFANSPLEGGEPTGWASFRGKVWLGMDPDRSGPLAQLLEEGFSFQRWAAFALEVPLLLIDAGGEMRPAPPMTFRDYMRQGIDGHLPTRHDWELHLSTIFTEVRLKLFIEVRGADATPCPIAVPAVWKGLLYGALDEAEAFSQRFPPSRLRSLTEDAAKHGVRVMGQWSREALKIAERGLGDEAGLLASAWEALERGPWTGEDRKRIEYP